MQLILFSHKVGRWWLTATANGNANLKRKQPAVISSKKISVSVHIQDTAQQHT